MLLGLLLKNAIAVFACAAKVPSFDASELKTLGCTIKHAKYFRKVMVSLLYVVITMLLLVLPQQSRYIRKKVVLISDCLVTDYLPTLPNSRQGREESDVEKHGRTKRRWGGGEEEEKQNRERLEGGESGEGAGDGDGAPDLTTPTHSGPSLLASCALRLILRGHAHTYIYLTTHAGR